MPRIFSLSFSAPLLDPSLADFRTELLADAQSTPDQPRWSLESFSFSCHSPTFSRPLIYRVAWRRRFPSSVCEAVKFSKDDNLVTVKYRCSLAKSEIPTEDDIVSWHCIRSIWTLSPNLGPSRNCSHVSRSSANLWQWISILSSPIYNTASKAATPASERPAVSPCDIGTWTPTEWSQMQITSPQHMSVLCSRLFSQKLQSATRTIKNSCSTSRETAARPVLQCFVERKQRDQKRS